MLLFLGKLRSVCQVTLVLETVGKHIVRTERASGVPDNCRACRDREVVEELLASDPKAWADYCEARRRLAMLRTQNTETR